MPSFLKNRAVQISLGVVVVALVVVAAVIGLRPRPNATIAQPAASTAAPVETTAAPTSDASPEETPGSSPTPVQTCTNFTGDMESPTKFEVDRMNVDSPMMVVGKDADGNPGAPPPNEAYTTAWYNGSPAPGTDQGNVILTIHTYSKGQALGNDLFGASGLKEPQPGKGLQEGDLIKVSDADGNQVCYRYTGQTKVWVKTYDPTSGVFHNPDGPPQLAIMICWDYNPGTKDWDSRIIFYASLIPEGTPAPAAGA